MENSKSTRILFVEDEPLALELMAKCLEENGYRTQSFACSRKALEWLQSHPEEIDILVTDQSMPKLTGTELAMKARQLCPRLPVVIVTGMGKVGSELKSSGPVGLVEKPYKRQELFSAIDILMEGNNEKSSTMAR